MFCSVHYPGTNSSDDALNSGLHIWASEDYSTFNDDVGAGCWARVSLSLISLMLLLFNFCSCRLSIKTM